LHFEVNFENNKGYFMPNYAQFKRFWRAMKNRKKGLYIPAQPGGKKWGEKAHGLWRLICEKSHPEIQLGDIHSLARLLFLVNEFEHRPSKELAEEIRLHAKQFGLQDEIGRFIT
jgi:hypothetical protein